MENLLDDFFFLPEGDYQGQNEHTLDKKAAKLKLIKVIYNFTQLIFSVKHL